MTIEIDLEQGKYTVVSHAGVLKALRYGDEWRDLSGDNLIGAMFDEIVELRNKLNYAPSNNVSDRPTLQQIGLEKKLISQDLMEEFHQQPNGLIKELIRSAIATIRAIAYLISCTKANPAKTALQDEDQQMYNHLSPSYQDIHNACVDLCAFFRANDIEFTRVVGIAKGGLLPAKIIAENLSIPMSVVHYSSQEGQGNNKDPYVYFPSIRNTEVILIVDDILDSGHTLTNVRQHYLNAGVAAYTYVLFHKKHEVPLIVPDFSWRTVKPDSDWIIFPHERKEKLK